MNKTKLITSALGISLLLGSAVPAFVHAESDDDSVQVSNDTSVNVNDDTNEHEGIRNFLSKVGINSSTTVRTKIDEHKASSTEKKMEKGEDKATSAIDKRIESLTKLSERLGKIKLLPADVLASIRASITAEIDALNVLKAKIAADTSTTTLKADAASITKANRVYLLVEPKARIAAASSRIKAVVTQLTDVTTKLQTRITAAQTAGVDVSAAVTAMTDMQAKLADAKVLADAAVTETVNLQADNGDKTIQATNAAALKDARTKLANAEKDLAAARHDAATIYSIVKGKGGVEGKGEVHASTSENH